MSSVALVTYLKALHIAALVFWCAGLVALPAMLLRRAAADDEPERRRIRIANRRAFVFMVSPAAFIAIGSGIALIFAATVFHPWLFLKLAAVGVMAVAHLQIGRVVMRVARDHDWQPPAWRLVPVLGGSLGAILAVLWLVLAKPAVGTQFLPWWLHQPLAVQTLSLAAPPLPPPEAAAAAASSSSTAASSSSPSSATMMPI